MVGVNGVAGVVALVVGEGRFAVFFDAFKRTDRSSKDESESSPSESSTILFENSLLDVTGR
jgi:hypothetical protein